MPSPHPRLDDLDRLFRSLRDAGFAVGVEESLRIETVLRGLGASPHSAHVALSEVVAAILLTDRDQRPELDRVVELWMQSLAPRQTESSEIRFPRSDPSSPKHANLLRAQQLKRRRIAWTIGGLGLPLGMALAVWFAVSRHERLKLPDAALTAPNERADLRPPATNLSVPAPDLGVRKEKPATHPVWVPTLTEQPRELPWAVWVWAGVAALSAMLGMGLWLALRNRSYLPTPLPLPTRPGLPRVVPSAEPNHRNQSFLLSRRDEDRAVWGIGQFISTDKTRRLDIPRTVKATADAAGQPLLHFVPARHAREVWLWLDESMGLRGDGSGDDARRFVAELAHVLTLAGLPVEQARCWGLPEELSSEHGMFTPSEVDERRDAALVLIFTDGELLRGALDSATDRPRVESLLRQLGHWPELAFVDSTQGEACLPALLHKYELLSLLPEQVPAFLAGQSAPTALPVHGRAGPMLIGEERAWAAALALSPTPVDDQTAHLVREHLRLSVSPWRIGVLRSHAQLEAGGLLFATPERARLLSWLLAVGGGSTGSDTWIGQALSFYRRLLDSEDQRRRQNEPAEPWLSTPSEHHLRMQQALLLLWDDPERAAEQLFRRYRDPLATEIRRHLAWLGPRECAHEVEHGVTILPWAMKDRTPRARLLLRELGLGSASLGWKPRAESLRRPGRLPLGLGLCAGLALLGLLGVFQSLPRRQGEPTVDNPSPPPGAVVKIKPLGAEQYEVLAHSGREQAQLTVAGGSLVHLAWDSHQEPDPTDAGTLADLGIDLSTPPDLTYPEDLAQREDLRKPKEGPDLAKPPEQPRDMTVVVAELRDLGTPPSTVDLGTAVAWSCPNQEWTEPTSGEVFVKVCGGTFQMGSANDPEAYSSETPSHPVKLSDYWIGKYEVSNGQYRKYQVDHKGQYEGNDLPVETVNWNEARGYCRSLGGDLPTEAEWEYAARGPEGRRYPWGNATPDAERATFGWMKRGPDAITANPRGRGPFGTLNQAGNVWEWVTDCYDEEGYTKRKAQIEKTTPALPVVNPVDDRSGCGDSRVLRGGSFASVPGDLRSAGRVRHLPEDRYQNLSRGFRCVRGSARQR